MWHGVKSFFHVIIIFQCILFAIYLLGYKDIKKSSKWLLVSFLFVKILTEVGGFLGHFLELRTILIDNSPLTLYAYYPFRLAYIPFIYLYIVSLTQKDFKFFPAPYRTFQTLKTAKENIFWHRLWPLKKSRSI